MAVTPLTFVQGVVEGFALLIASDADPSLGISWDPSQKYNPAVTGIYLGGLPLDETGKPNIGTAIALTPYPLTDDAALADSEVGIQIKSRAANADIRQAWAIDSGIFDVLEGRWSFTLPSGIAVTTVSRSSGGNDGKDNADRQVLISNYTALVHRPSAHRL